MPSERDTSFGRFAFVVTTMGVVAVVLGLATIYYVVKGGNLGSTSGALRDAVSGRSGPSGKLPPDKAMLYYTKDGRQLVGVVTSVGQGATEPTEKARVIIKSLTEGRDADALKSPIPPGTQLKSVFIKDNIAIVNLTKEYATNLRGGVEAEVLAVYSIVNSLLFNIEGITAVQLKIDGEELPTLHGQVDISSPLIGNMAITRSM